MCDCAGGIPCGLVGGGTCCFCGWFLDVREFGRVVVSILGAETLFYICMALSREYVRELRLNLIALVFILY